MAQPSVNTSTTSKESTTSKSPTMRLKVVYTLHERNADGSYGSSSTHVARSASGISRPAAESSGTGEENEQQATTYLKSCLALICYTRPDLIPDAHTDYSVSALDIVESAAGHGKVFEGQGMMGWILAEHNAGSTCIAGRLLKPAQREHAGDSSSAAPAEETLEVVLELKPRKPIPRKDFLSTLSSSSKAQPPHVQQEAASPAPASAQTVTLPNGSTMDSSVVLAMLQTLFTAAAESNQPTSGNEESPEASGTHARNIVNHLNSGMPLLPGINLFNPIQAKAVQQQLSASSPASASSHGFPPLKPRPIKAKSAIAKQQHSSRGSTSGNHHPMSESNANIGEFSFPGRDEARGQNSESRSYVPKKQALAGSSAHPASEPMHPQPVRLKHWPAGCLQCGKTESRQWRVKQKRKKALDGTDLDPSLLPDDGHISKLCEECAQKLPSMKMKKKRKADPVQDDTSTVNPAYRPILPNTSPLRRSPRRHASSSLNRSTLLSAQPLTSPTGLGSHAQSGKRRKFTSALSAAALRVESNTAEGLTPDEGSFIQEIPQFKLHTSGRDTGTNHNDYDATPQQAKEVFGNPAPSNLLPPTKEGPISHEDEGFNFFLNASPGTIMRSFNIMSPQKNGTPTNDPSSIATLRAFPNIGLSPLQNKLISSDAVGTSAVFSPLGSSLSTPFRALLNPNAAAGKGRERATSEQPPASHSRLMQELELRDSDTTQGQQILDVPGKPSIAAPQFLSSDDNLLGSASNVQINLLPATADRRQGGKPDAIAENHLLSDSIMNDFNSFLLNSSNGLFSPTPFIPKQDAAGKPALAPLTLPNLHDSTKQRSLSPLAVLSSEMDIDLSNLPPSSPPPLPGRSTSGQHISSASLANVQDFWNTFNAGMTSNGGYLASNRNGPGNGQMDDGQSPISISTTVTQGGTPQDVPISHDTGPSEPGQSHIPSVSRVSKTGTSSNMDSPLSLQDNDSVQDPLFEYFSFGSDVAGGSTHDYASHQRQSSASSVSSAFLERLKKSTSGQGNGSNVTRSSSSSMAMTWSDSTASVSSLASLPVTDLTARSKLLQKQKALEEAKRTSIPIDSAVLENAIDAFLDLDD